jgi:hypothetical protein
MATNTQVSQDPYAEFGGVPVSQSSPQTGPQTQQAAPDPYAEFGGVPVNASSSTSAPGLLERTGLAPDAEGSGIVRNVVAGAENLASGFNKDLAATGAGIYDAVGGALKKVLPASLGNQIPNAKIAIGDTDPHGIAQNLGAGAGELAQWASQEAGLAKILKFAAAPEGVLQLIEKYPKAYEAVKAVLDEAGGETKAAKVAKQGMVGGVTAGEHGQDVGTGVLGGAAGGALAEYGAPGLTATGKAIGIGKTAEELATVAAKPGKRNVNWSDAWQRSAPYIADQHVNNKPIKNIKDMADAALEASHDLWNNKVLPLVKGHENDLLNVNSVADGVRDHITPSMTKLSSEKAKGIEQIANSYAGSGSMMNIGEIEKDIEHLNAELTTNGWWKKSASERAAAIKSGDPDGAKSVAADKLRDVIYDHIDSFKSPTGDQPSIRELKKDYGALRNIENEFRGQVNVQGRQSIVGLKQTLGALAGAAHGGPVGVGMAILPLLDKIANSPDASAGRAARLAARAIKTGSADTTAVAAAKDTANRAVKAIPGVAWENAAQWIRFKGGDGQDYEHHPDESMEEIQRRDPAAYYPASNE